MFVFFFGSKFLRKVNELKIQTSAICIFPHIDCHGLNPGDSKCTRTHKNICKILCNILTNSSRCCRGASASVEGGPFVCSGTIHMWRCGWMHKENDNFLHLLRYSSPAQAIQAVQEQPGKQARLNSQTNRALKPGSLASFDKERGSVNSSRSGQSWPRSAVREAEPLCSWQKEKYLLFNRIQKLPKEV